MMITGHGAMEHERPVGWKCCNLLIKSELLELAEVYVRLATARKSMIRDQDHVLP
jgi:hypothetical protein